MIIKALSDQRMTEICTPVVYGAAKVSGYYKKVLDVPNLQFNIVVSADSILPDRVNFVNCFDDELKVEIGKPSQVAGEASLKALEIAVKDLKEGEVDVLVTAPINKNTIQSDKFNFTGHTEYLQDRHGNLPWSVLQSAYLQHRRFQRGHVHCPVLSELLPHCEPVW